MIALQDATTPTGRTSSPAGRPPKLDQGTLLLVRELLTNHSGASMNELIDIIENATGIRVSQTTLRSRLREMGFKRVVPARTPPRAGTVLHLPAVAEAAVAPRRYGYGPAHREKALEAMYMHGIGDAEWLVIAYIFDDKVRGTERKYTRRQMLDAIAFVVRGGIPWRMLPAEFPPWNLVFRTFRRWSRQGRFEKMCDRLRALWRQREGRAPEPTAAVIDSQSTKTSAQGGPKGFDGAKKIKGRKRHLLTDTLGLLLAAVVHVASIQDRNGADVVVAAGLAKVPTITKIYADEGYAGQCKKRLEANHRGLNVEIARHPGNRSVGHRLTAQQTLPLASLGPKKFVPLPKRWVIERTHGWNDRPRRMTKDQDRTIESSTAWVWFVEGRRLLRRLAGRPEIFV